MSSPATVNTSSSTKYELYRRLKTPVSFIVRDQADVEHIHIQESVNQVRLSGRVLMLPEEYWFYRHTDKLVNTHLISDPFEPHKVLVKRLPGKTESSSTLIAAEAVLQDRRTIKRAQWQADKIAQRRDLKSAKTEANRPSLQIAPQAGATEAKTGWVGRLVESHRLKPTAKEFHPTASMRQLQQSTIREPLRTPSPIPQAHRQTSSASIPAGYCGADRPALLTGQRASSKLAECETGSCSSSEALSEHEDFYPTHWKKAGKAERKRKRHYSKKQHLENQVNTLQTV